MTSNILDNPRERGITLRNLVPDDSRCTIFPARFSPLYSGQTLGSKNRLSLNRKKNMCNNQSCPSYTTDILGCLFSMRTDDLPPSISSAYRYIDVVFMHYRIRSARKPRLEAFQSGNVRLTSSVSSSFSLVNVMVHLRMFLFFPFPFYVVTCFFLFVFFAWRSWRFSLIGKNRWCNNHLQRKQPELRNKLDSHG